MSIQVTNLVSEATLTYSLPILVGEVTPPLTQGHLKVTCCSEGRPRLWPIYNGQFKVLVPLKHGENRIELHFFDETVDFVLHYRVPTIKKYVRPIYIRPCDDVGSFQGPDSEDTSAESALQRIALAAKLIQSFTAEKLHEHGLGRKTFVLESDLNPDCPPCHIFTSKMNLKRARETAGGDLWMSFARELMSSKLFKEKDNVKWYAFMSFTYYVPPEGVVPKSHSEVIRFTQGHTALGGGGLALFGTGNLHTWATSLDEFIPRFTDIRKIDRSKLMDDSAYRQYSWANYSTGLGASLHELGHTFDLAHTPTGIMSRGFDDIYRTFLAQPMTVSRGSLSRDSSRLSSPIPYSPKESPVHKPRRRESFNEQKSGSGSRSSSPKPCPLSRPPQGRAGVAMMPSVIQIETAFRRVTVENTQTLVVHNYDGSKTKKTIIRNRDGTETISEVTTYPDGKQSAREIIKHLATGKTRTTMSMSTTVEANHFQKERKPSCNHSSGAQSNDISKITSASSGGSPAHNPSQLTSVIDPARLPKALEVGATSSDSSMSFQEVKYKDGGAHWYRSSAIMLSSHKWFNELRNGDPHKPPEITNGTVRVMGDRGLRIVELRSLPEGVVFHHWEFLQDQPPTAFSLSHSEIMQLSHNAEQITVVAEDDYGNIVKKKVSVADLKRKTEQTVDSKTEEQFDLKADVTKATTTSEEITKESTVRIEDLKSNVDADHKVADLKQQTNIAKLSKTEEQSAKIGDVHSTTTSNSTEISEINSSDDTSQILLSGSNGSNSLQASVRLQNADPALTTEAKNVYDENSKDQRFNHIQSNSKDSSQVDSTGQHASRDDIQGIASDKVNGTCAPIGKQNLQVEIAESKKEDTVSLNVVSHSEVESRPAQSSSSITGKGITTGESDTVVRVLFNHVNDFTNATDDLLVSEVSETDEEVMKDSAGSHESGEGELVNGDQETRVVDVVGVDNQVDNFNLNEQHNIAVQQTVESNRSEKEGNEMVDSFHVENGNTNI